MAVLLRATQLILLLLSPLALYLTWYLALNNGTIQPPQDPLVLPGSGSLPVRVSYTGITAVDRQLGVLSIFFWPMIDGSSPGLSLHSLQFAGEIVAFWTLYMLEGMRKGNKGIVTMIMIWGVILQNVTFAGTIPIYLVIHLLTSPLVSPNSAADALPDESSNAGVLPLSVISGLVVPTVLFTLPYPSVVDLETKQLLMSIWQAFPIWVSLAQQVLKRVVPTSLSTQNRVRAVRNAYVFALVASSLTRVSVLAISISSVLFPTMFADGFHAELAPSSVFVPAAITAAHKVPSFAAGVTLLLQWDQLVGGTATLLWTIVLYVGAQNQQRRPKSALEQATFFTGIVALAIILGPAAGSVAALWARDETLFSLEATKDKKNA